MHSAVFLTPLNIDNYLGEVTRKNGQIVSAKATYIQWFGKINSSDIIEDDVSSMGTGEIVDRASLEWELALRDELMVGVVLLTYASCKSVKRSFNTASGISP